MSIEMIINAALVTAALAISFSIGRRQGRESLINDILNSDKFAFVSKKSGKRKAFLSYEEVSRLQEEEFVLHTQRIEELAQELKRSLVEKKK